MMLTRPRRLFRGALALLVETLGLLLHSDAQQLWEKPQIKLSEVRPLIRHYVDDMAKDAEKSGIEVISEENRAKMVEIIISEMKAQGTYDFVEP
jgi:hypothetical protein